ncbi:unnamed protein product [Auanema sp. JU1783]|nr:unnamed protein product [Auanema sp. JU1783]
MYLKIWLALFVVAWAAPPQRVNQPEPVTSTHAPSPAPNSAENAKHDDAHESGRRNPYELSYNRYLEKVVEILESDKNFRERLRDMPEEQIKEGRIADHFHELPKEIHNQLHKIKLEEIESIRAQIEKQIEADKGAHNIKIPEHLDLNQWETFGQEDLRMLIKKTVADMDEIDNQRREEFKKYEMRKKAERDHKLASMTEQERAAEMNREEQLKKRVHEKLKHPASKTQLEDVWVESDKMTKDTFNPRTFFGLHDLNGDGFWNSEELESLFNIELEKMYNSTDPDYDAREKTEEMYRMREHVVKQMDKNGDRLISLEEFMQDTEAQTGGQDKGWDELSSEDLFTPEELKEYEDVLAKEMNWGDNAYDSKIDNTIHDQPQVQNSNAGATHNLNADTQNVHVEPAQRPTVDPTYGI